MVYVLVLFYPSTRSALRSGDKTSQSSLGSVIYKTFLVLKICILRQDRRAGTKIFCSTLATPRWQEYEPLLTYCRDNGVRLIACGVPLEVLRTVQAEGVEIICRYNFPNQSAPYGPSSYLSIQARVVEDYTMSQIILQAVVDGGSTGMLVVVTGANHVTYGSRGTGLPARISRKMQKRNQVVILLDPERQYIQREGEVPVADFLWYSAARPCSRNCFDRAEIARVMNAVGRKRDALPQGLERERLLADPKFLHRLAIEESISITTTLLAQYQKRKESFFEELDYVVTDTLRGIVDFFTVWLPAPTYHSSQNVSDIDAPDSVEALKGVGIISSIGAVASSNVLCVVRKLFNPSFASEQQNKRSPILKTALVYGSFLGTSANLRYQLHCYDEVLLLNNIVASSFAMHVHENAEKMELMEPIGLVEHRISEQFSDQTLLVNMISFVARTINSYWGTQVYKLVRVKNFPSNSAALECNILEDGNIDESNEQ
ncbi:hypothetical protein BUALT_Bualt06G0083200 [Buddleja alternifolia]|uniref:Haem-binding uptake Tiki superfamily ChaN domain-containing protein n=1 Tax=Buddleja alternifolia TaxID=168488 RepID=A0AAV6XI15_9LAMI|nr:hypothetical protein BUALT_Bualt06G0083200 [Buddleja alternifolia]